MKIICSWCNKDMGEKEPKENKAVSHTICHECSKNLKEKEKGKKQIQKAGEGMRMPSPK